MSKIGNIFVNEKILEEYSVRIPEIDPFLWLWHRKKQVDKNECEYILFRVDVYFAKYLLATQIDEKQHVDRDLIFDQKIQEALEKLGCKFIRINTIK